jgi:hypothetical protein
MLRRSLSVLALGACISMSRPAQAAGNPNPGILPPHAKYGGLTLGEWNVRLWQRLYRHLAFTPDSPTFDLTGANFGVDQSGPVWFLTLPAERSSVREVTVPVGVALLVTVGSGSFGGLPLDPPTDQLVVLSQWALANNIQNPELCVDGRPVKDLSDYAVVSPFFNFTLPDGNPTGSPAGNYGPAVANGYTPLLAPMASGHHVIHFSWDVVTGIWAGHWDETYLVNVVPGH